MKTVREFTVDTENLSDVVSVTMPVSAKPLTAQNRFGRLSIWALVEIGSTLIERRPFRLTGPMPDGETDRFLGTVQLNGGNIVLHVFDLRKAE
jgi:hypothetical protein